jgi:hypothetical protein
MKRAEVADALGRAIEAGDHLGLDTSGARVVAATIEERGGYPSDLYVLALAGGTGVGKSSLLNAIAGEEVSPAGVRRPTTSIPVAWVPADHHEDAAPLIDWLGGADMRSSAAAGQGAAGQGAAGQGAAGQAPAEGAAGRAVAIVDLPDLDSIEPAHAARVDAVLPRVDAVLWVTDPEKYDDAVLHDGYLRRWMPRLAHQAVVVNKVDRLGTVDAQRVRDDLAGRLRSEGLPPVPVLLVSARRGIDPLLAWLRNGAAAKEVVSARLRAAAADEVRSLAAAGGVEGAGEPAPLVPSEARSRGVAAATAALLDVVDLPGLRRQAVAATRANARPVGGGPLGLARSLLERGAGTTERHADPEGYLRRWRERGSPDRAVGAVRDMVATSLTGVSPEMRPSLVGLAGSAALADRFGAVVDAAVTGPVGVFRAPASRWWPLLGLGQLVATAAVAAGAIWLVALLAAGGAVPTPTLDLPGLGPMPTPAALLLGGLGAWFALGRLLHWHAGRLGRTWADGLAEDIRRRVTEVVDQAVSGPLARHDAARKALWSALRTLRP